MKKLLLFPLLLTTNIAFSANWVKTGSGTSIFGDFNAYVDTNSIKKVDNYPSQKVRYFEQQAYEKAHKTYEGKYVTYTISPIIADCVTLKYLSSSTVSYSKNGKIVNSVSVPESNWIDATPNSIGEYEIKLACKMVGY